jgi:hypothetical protein
MEFKMYSHLFGRSPEGENFIRIYGDHQIREIDQKISTLEGYFISKDPLFGEDLSRTFNIVEEGMDDFERIYRGKFLFFGGED